jgi:hypothetical protein
MASSIHAEIETSVKVLCTKLRGGADAQTLKMLCDVMRSVDKLRMYVDKDFEHLWLTELNEKQQIKFEAMEAQALGRSSPVYAAPAPTPKPRDSTPSRPQVLNPELDTAFDFDISSIHLAPEEEQTYD